MAVSIQQLLKSNLPQGSGALNFSLHIGDVFPKANQYLFIDTRTSKSNVYLPTTQFSGDFIFVTDAYGTFNQNNVTVLTNNSTILSNTSNVSLSSSAGEFLFVFLANTWFLYENQTFLYNGLLQKPILFLSATSEYESSNITVTITNYIEYTGVYSVSVSGGSYSRQSETIIWTLPAVSEITNHTITVTYTVPGGNISTQGTVSVLSIPSNYDTAVVWDLTTSTYSNGWN